MEVLICKFDRYTGIVNFSLAKTNSN